MSDSYYIPEVPDESYQESPFKPGFGVIPPRLADRQELINNFARTLDQGPGARGQATLLTGRRGTGKSVMLTVFADVAASRGWVTATSSAGPGFVEELGNTVIPLAMRDLDAVQGGNTRVTGGSVSFMGFGGSVQTSRDERFPVTPTFRSQLLEAASALQEHGSGLLITLDEVHRSSVDELRKVTDAIAVAIPQELPVALVAAGLPSSINELVNDHVSTFLRRAQRVELGNLTPEGARDGLEAPMAGTSKSFTPDALEAAVEATRGYPYLVQLVGDESFKAAGGSHLVTADHVQEAARAAEQAMYVDIHAATVLPLSNNDRRYLFAMTADAGPSRTSDVARRLEMDTRTAGVYRDRLIAEGVIEPATRGYVSYTLPYMREYLIANPGSQEQRLASNLVETERALQAEARTSTPAYPQNTPSSGRAPGLLGNRGFDPLAGSSSEHAQSGRHVRDAGQRSRGRDESGRGR